MGIWKNSTHHSPCDGTFGTGFQRSIAIVTLRGHTIAAAHTNLVPVAIGNTIGGYIFMGVIF
jgi:formate/nitrite transporter FocA (FNT family)